VQQNPPELLGKGGIPSDGSDIDVENGGYVLILWGVVCFLILILRSLSSFASYAA
jgi:hypothetical protein